MKLGKNVRKTTSLNFPDIKEAPITKHISQRIKISKFLFCFVCCASLFNLVNKTNLVDNFSYYVYFFSLHVSGDYVPIIRRNDCVYATLGTCYSVWITVWYAYQTWYERHSSIQDNKYQVSHKYSWFSCWWAHNRQKHVEKRNKHTKKNCAPGWFYLPPTPKKKEIYVYVCIFVYMWVQFYVFLNLGLSLQQEKET